VAQDAILRHVRPARVVCYNPPQAIPGFHQSSWRSAITLISSPNSHAPIVGVDVGGTFTDLVYFAEGRLHIFKLLSTKADPSTALLAGLAALNVAAEAIVSHGTTVATNAVLEHSGARTALITTRGFRDVLAIGRQTRPALYRLAFAPRWLPVADGLRFEVTERIGPGGEILTPLDEAETATVLRQVVAAGAQSLAICLLFSFANPVHEARLKQMAEAHGLAVSVSSEILPEFREYERTSTTVLNAYVMPLMDGYLARLEAGLASRGQSGGQFGVETPGRTREAGGPRPASGPRLWIMQSSGGILSASAARRQPVRTLLSGPAAGVMGAVFVAKTAGCDQIITFDMGGTSTDVALPGGSPWLADAAISHTHEGRPGFDGLGGIEGWPVRVPMLDIHTVGAGGGSIAWVDAGGALRVGPQSAGSEPGPACYGRASAGAGPVFTVTDANLLLGRLDAARFLGGRMRLHRAAAEAAADPLAALLGMTPVELAEGVLRVANARMEQAIRVISVARGFDPRGFALLPFGGAGPMHALDLAEALLVSRVLIPRHPGVLSALGLVLADFTTDHSRTVMRRLVEVDRAALAALFAPLLAQGQADLMAEGFPPQATGLEQALDLRYRGQSFELTIPADETDPVMAARHFHAAHEQRYGYARPMPPGSDPRAGIELVNVRVTARGRRSRPEFTAQTPTPSPDPAAAQVGQTRLRAGGQWQLAPVYERDLLCPGGRLAGPALVVQEDATIVIIPGWSGQVDPWLNLVCERREER